MLWLSRGYGDSWIELLIFLLPAASLSRFISSPWSESTGSPLYIGKISSPISAATSNPSRLPLIFFEIFAWLRDEAIAHAADRKQMPRLRGIVFNVATQTDHEIIDGASVSVFVQTPNLFED